MKKRRPLTLFTTFILILTLTLTYTVTDFTCSAAAYPQILTLKQAVTSAVSTSYAIRKIKNDMALKKIELKQAIQAIKDIRKKESTIQFSLLFNIKFPESHALPKELELVMKVPKIESDMKDLDRKLVNTRLNVVTSTQIAYFNIIELMENCSSTERRISSDKDTYLRLSKEYSLGNAKKEDVEEMKKSISKLEKDYQSNLLRFENSKKKLSEIIGIDITKGYTFSKDLSQLRLTRGQLADIIDYALKNDYKVYQAELARKIADTEVATLSNIYNSRWGSMVNVIQSDLAKKEPLDFNAFLDKYHAALDNIERPYEGYYKIRILFITIKIPKEWFRSELSGIRYFEDQKYALYISLMDRESAVKEEAEARKALKSQIEDGFNSLLELWSAYEESSKEVAKAQLQYEQVKKQNLTGNASFMDVESAKNDVVSCENTVVSALITYNSTLASFDFSTAGAISSLTSGVSLKPGNQNSSGLSWLDELDDDDKPKWYLSTLIDEYKFVFRVSIPDAANIDATHYELCTEDGELIGSRTAIDKAVSHVPLVYEGTTKLLVKLYKDTTHIFTAEIDAAEVSGTLELLPTASVNGITPNTAISPGTSLGSWILTKNNIGYTSRLVLNLDEKWKIGYYSLESSTGSLIGNDKIPLTTPLSHLSITFSSPEKLTLKLYDKEGNFMGNASIINDMDIRTVKMK